ncbi:MAG: hypothetical protein FVQ77_07520 [Cytophagales bacterium]|nr:hypothetical protein [Cytophagales bacterium]
MKNVVCDTGPVLHLKQSNLLWLLKKAGKILIPLKVNEELQYLDKSWLDQKPSWIIVNTLIKEDSDEASLLLNSGLLDAGESEAVILAKRVKALWFLTDDSAARIFANSIDLEVHGSLGIVLWGTAVGHLNYNEARSAIYQLERSTLWMSQTIIDKAYKSLKDIFIK